ncbi:MAG: glycosyltransferase family 2 protein [Thermus sp.]|nr:glycosyltransferase family 2 protein [Thermus sp.]
MSERVPVSVIIPCYQCSGTIRRALESVLSQTWLPGEVIVVVDGDGGDGLDQALYQLRSQFLQKGVRLEVLWFETNRGPGAARNWGWERAKEEYVAFLDADDTWHPRKLEEQLRLHKKTAVAVSAHRYARNTSLEETGIGEESVHFLTARDLLLGNRISTPTVLLRRDIPFRFREQGLAEDYYLWLKLVLSGTKIALIRKPLAFGYKAAWGEGGLSAKLWQMEKGELSVLLQLCQEGLYARAFFPLLAVWSLAKFVRRLVLWGLRQFVRTVGGYVSKS